MSDPLKDPWKENESEQRYKITIVPEGLSLRKQKQLVDAVFGRRRQLWPAFMFGLFAIISLVLHLDESSRVYISIKDISSINMGIAVVFIFAAVITVTPIYIVYPTKKERKP